SLSPNPCRRTAKSASSGSRDQWRTASRIAASGSGGSTAVRLLRLTASLSGGHPLAVGFTTSRDGPSAGAASSVLLIVLLVTPLRLCTRPPFRKLALIFGP